MKAESQKHENVKVHQLTTSEVNEPIFFCKVDCPYDLLDELIARLSINLQHNTKTQGIVCYGMWL